MFRENCLWSESDKRDYADLLSFMMLGNVGDFAVSFFERESKDKQSQGREVPNTTRV